MMFAIPLNSFVWFNKLTANQRRRDCCMVCVFSRMKSDRTLLLNIFDYTFDIQALTFPLYVVSNERKTKLIKPVPRIQHVIAASLNHLFAAFLTRAKLSDP